MLDDDGMVMGTALAKEDSVVAGQSVQLTITASDANLNNRAAVAYRSDVMVVAMGFGLVTMSCLSRATGVKDNGDGTATLAGAIVGVLACSRTFS